MQKEFPLKILVVDDEPAILRTLSALLHLEGYSCETEADPVAALERLRTEMFHLLITDLVMPGLDGLELVRQLRHENGFAQVIIMTAHSTLDRAVEAYGLGASDYLLKPFRNLDEVLHLVREAHGRLRRWHDAMARTLQEGRVGR